MKHSYSKALLGFAHQRYWLVLLLLLLPVLSFAQTLEVAPATLTFGTVAIGTTSPVQSFTITGEDLVNEVRIIFPETVKGVEGSITNSVGSFSNNTLTVNPDANGIINTVVYVHFKPTRSGSITPASITIVSLDEDEEEILAGVTVTGTGARPSLIASTASLAFPDTQVGATSAVQSFTVNGTSLESDVTVRAPAGYQVSRGGANSFASSITLPASNNSVVSATVDVRFVPQAVGSTAGNIRLEATNAVTRNVAVSGNGTPGAAITVAPASLADFGTVVVGAKSAAQSFTVSGTNLQSDITVQLPNGFQGSVDGGTTYTSGALTLPQTNNAVNNATVLVLFAPVQGQSGAINSNVAVTATGATQQNVAVSGTAQPAPMLTANPTTLDFGTVASNGSGQALTFTVTGSGLSSTSVTLTVSDNAITLRNPAAGGSYTNQLTVPVINGAVSQTVQVRLQSPVPVNAFSGIIRLTPANAADNVQAQVAVVATSTGSNAVINASGTLTQFSTVPGVASASQSYTISGSNLVSDITIQAPNLFQISTLSTFADVTAGATGNTITVPRRSTTNDVVATAIYVRYLPPGAQTNSDNIVNNSQPAVGVAVPVNGTSQPTVQLANAVAAIRNVVIGTNSASQAISFTANRVRKPVTLSLVTTSNTLNTGNRPQYELSLDNVNFSSTLVITPDQSTYTASRTIYVRYKPSYLGQADAQLQYQSEDFSITTPQNFDTNGQITGRSIDTEPTRASEISVTRDLENGTATVLFNLPPNYAAAGYGEGRLIIASTSSNLPRDRQPQDGTGYQVGNQVYGQGPQIAPGYFAVYAGPNASATIEGLDNRRTYYFYVFEFNNIFTYVDQDGNAQTVSVSGAENYRTPATPEPIPGLIAPGTDPLPVELMAFSAKRNSSVVNLAWSTASEKNNKGFQVERSEDGKTFTVLQFVTGKGTSNRQSDYKATDAAPLSSVSYYRLKQIDNDGTFAYSPVVAVQGATEVVETEVSMYPNPVQHTLHIALGHSAAGASATVTDLTGRVALTSTLGAEGKLNMSSLPAGTYLVTVTSNTQKVTRKVVKN